MLRRVSDGAERAVGAGSVGTVGTRVGARSVGVCIAGAWMGLDAHPELATMRSASDSHAAGDWCFMFAHRVTYAVGLMRLGASCLTA